jgi:hypothetical protein
MNLTGYIRIVPMALPIVVATLVMLPSRSKALETCMFELGSQALNQKLQISE